MQYHQVNTKDLFKAETLVLGFFADQGANDGEVAIEAARPGLLAKLKSKCKEFADLSWQQDAEGCSLLVIHCGAAKDFGQTSLKKILALAVKQLQQNKVKTAHFCLPKLQDKSLEASFETSLLQIDALCYEFLALKTKDCKSQSLETIGLYASSDQTLSLEQAKQLAEAVRYCRTLGNLPANHCTPSYLAAEAEKLAKADSKLELRIFDKEEMQNMGMGSLLSVSQGSIQAPKLIELQYQGADKSQAPVILVGKGITFDAGGITLKPGEGMNEMKYDMCGAATVLACLKACAALKLPINLIGLAACSENLPSGSATKPGDVVKSMSGQTIEIINTDAEGRLVLADALSYAERFKPRYVIDIATLTGAIIVALGQVYTGFMSPSDELADLLLQASHESGDKAWRMPLDSEYQDALKSNVADMANARFDRSAGSITAACFLSRFTEKLTWAHLDIAGTAWVSGKEANATGRPVLLLMQFLRHVSQAR